MIRAVTLEDAIMVCKRGVPQPNHPTQPTVFDLVNVTLSANNIASQAITGLNAYVHSVSALERKPDSEFIALTLRFRDLTDQQRDTLSQFILGQS